MMRSRQARLSTSATRAVRVGCVAVVLILRAAAPSPANALAPSQIVSTESHVTYSFADEMTFSIHALSGTPIDRCYLFFRAATEERTRSVEISVLPAPEIFVTHTVRLQEAPLPPFASISYWWEFRDTDGNRVTTASRDVQYNDNRFEWQMVADGPLTIYWLEGDARFGQAALDIARTSLMEIALELGAPQPKPVSIYIYDSQAQLARAMGIARRDWAAGQAHPELGTIVIAVPNRDGYTNQMANFIPHEISHLLVYAVMTPAGYQYAPEWLDEGIAVVNEGLPTPEYAVALQQAAEDGQLMSLADLCRPFPSDAYGARLAYAQSGSIVRFIREEYGVHQIRGLLQAYAGGASCAVGIEEELGLSMDGLETRWRNSLAPRGVWRTYAEQYGPYIGILVLGLLLAIPMVGLGISRSSNGHR
ncbi:MAG: hypothetical protein GX620_01860 [Chloroflexi bacterium]|nr:hypothetical protein [Chloroflexota bacterium]